MKIMTLSHWQSKAKIYQKVMNMLSAVLAGPSIIHQQKHYNHGKQCLNKQRYYCSAVRDSHLTEEDRAGVSGHEFRACQRCSAVLLRDVQWPLLPVQSHLFHFSSLLYRHKSTRFSCYCWWFATDLGAMVENSSFIAVSPSSFQWAKEHGKKAVIPLGSTCSHFWHQQLEAKD